MCVQRLWGMTPLRASGAVPMLMDTPCLPGTLNYGSMTPSLHSALLPRSQGPIWSANDGDLGDDL